MQTSAATPANPGYPQASHPMAAAVLARIWHPANDSYTWLALGICPAIAAVGVPLFFRDRKKGWGNTLGLYFCGLYVLLAILIWIGAAAGIK